MLQQNKTEQSIQLIEPRNVQLIYTESQPIDALTDPVDDPCGTKCKGGSCNKDEAISDEVAGILIF